MVGINSETQLGEDMVLVTSDESGLENEYSLSKLEAILKNMLLLTLMVFQIWL